MITQNRTTIQTKLNQTQGLNTQELIKETRHGWQD